MIETSQADVSSAASPVRSRHHAGVQEQRVCALRGDDPHGSILGSRGRGEEGTSEGHSVGAEHMSRTYTDSYEREGAHGLRCWFDSR
jgi:hypothetical protein